MVLGVKDHWIGMTLEGWYVRCGTFRYNSEENVEEVN